MASSAGAGCLLPLAYDDAGVGRSEVLREAALGVLDAHFADPHFLVGGSPTIDAIVSYGDIAFAKVSARNRAEWSNAVASADGEGFSGFAAPSALLAIRGSVIPA